MDEEQPPAAEHQEDRSAVVRVQPTPRSDSCRTTPHRRRQCHARQLSSGPRCLPERRCVHDNTHFTNGCELFRHPTPDTERPEVAASSCCYVAGHCSLVLTRLDYCKSVLVGLPAKLLNRLHAVINAVARLICSARKSEHNHTNTDGPPLATYHRPLMLRIQEKIPIQTLCPGVQV